MSSGRRFIGEWDFGDGRGIVPFEVVMPPGHCTCWQCVLNHAADEMRRGRGRGSENDRRH